MGSPAEHILSLLAFLMFVAAPVPLGLWVVTRREEVGQRHLSLAQVWLSLLAVWCVVQALVAHTLGLVHQLRFSSALLAELAILAGGTAALWRRGATASWADRARHLAPAGGLETLCLLALAAMGLILLWWCAAVPVINWDSWAFHMPHMAEWLQSGTFTRLAQGAERPRNWYPYGWEALCTLFLMPFGEDMLVTLPNLIAWVLLGLAAYLLARLYRARRSDALACATCLLAIHYVADAVNTMHVDLPLAALFAASAYTGAVWARGGDVFALALSMATAGLACATRTTGPAYALLLAAWVLFVRRIESQPVRPQTRGNRVPVLLGIVAALGLGAFWYAKNVIEVGHPLGAGMPTSGPKTTERTWAYFASHTLAFAFDPLQPSSWKAVFDRTFHELDAPFVALVAMAALWPLARLWARPDRRERSALALALLVVATGAAFAFTPLSAMNAMQARLGLPFLAMLAVAAAVGATRARLHSAVPVAFALISATRTFHGSKVLFPLMLLALAWGAWRPRHEVHLSRGRALAAAGAVLLALALATSLARDRREAKRRDVYGPFHADLEQHAAPGEPVAYLLSHRSYLFYGRRLARSVVYAPLAADQRVEDWTERLRQRGVGIVAIGPWNQDDPAERDAVTRLMEPNGPLIWFGGSRATNQIGLFRLTPAADTHDTGNAS